MLNANTEETEDDKVEFSNRCGILRWRPNFLQSLRSLYLFLAVLCGVSIMQTAISAGYLASQITTLERRFSLDSSSIGVITSFFDIGFIFMAMFVSYFGGRSRIPVWIGTGMICTSLGAFMMATPEWISPLPNTGISGDNTSGGNKYGTVGAEGCLQTAKLSNCSSAGKQGILVKLVFIAGQFITGGGSSPILSLGPTYIDDHVSPHVAAPLIALAYASNALGPVVGFAVGAITLKYPVDTRLFAHLSYDSPEWIGAWWLGYIFLGFICIFLGLLLFCFPRKVRRIHEIRPPRFLTSRSRTTNQSNVQVEPNNDEENNSVERNDYGQNFKDFPKAVKSLLTNKIFVIVTIGVCFELFLVNGFAQFLPKYIEAEYKVSTITACIIAGSIIVPAGALGILFGGIIMHRYKLNRNQAVSMSIIGLGLVVVCLILFLTLGCPRNDFAGVFKSITINNEVYTNLSNQCVQKNCRECDKNNFQPICDTMSGITYFSPCFAGCTKLTSEKSMNFSDCKCIQPHNNTLPPNKNTILTLGECPLRCNNLITFIVFVVFALLLTGLTQNPILMVTIRSVKKEERSFALGFQFALMRLFAYVPSPILFGFAIDKACVHWRYFRSCTNKLQTGESVNVRGDCIITDPVLLTNYLIGLCLALKSCACITYCVLLYVLVRYSHKYPSSQREINDIISVSPDVELHQKMLLYVTSDTDKPANTLVSVSPVHKMPTTTTTGESTVSTDATSTLNIDNKSSVSPTNN